MICDVVFIGSVGSLLCFIVERDCFSDLDIF